MKLHWKRRLSKALNALVIILACIQSTFVVSSQYTLEHMSTDSCGAHTSDPYYYAYNSFAGFQYQVVHLGDIDHYGSKRSSLAIGGRTTNCKSLAPSPSGCSRDVGAFIMLYNHVVQTAPDKLFVTSEVTV